MNSSTECHDLNTLNECLWVSAL